jgi:hypothetical protein
MFSVSVSSPWSVCTKHSNVSNNDGATDVADMCCLKLNLKCRFMVVFCACSKEVRWYERGT